MIIKEYETVDKFVAPRIKWLQYGFRDGLVKCPSSLNDFFFFATIVTLQGLEGKHVVFRGERKIMSSCMISVMTIRKLLRKGCIAYLTYTLEVKKKRMEVSNIPIVMKFLEVFSKVNKTSSFQVE